MEPRFMNTFSWHPLDTDSFLCPCSLNSTRLIQTHVMRTTDVTCFLAQSTVFKWQFECPYCLALHCQQSRSQGLSSSRPSEPSLLSRLGGKMRDPGNDVALSTACCNKLFLSDGKKLQSTACRFSQRYSTFVHGVEWIEDVYFRLFWHQTIMHRTIYDYM